MIGAASAAAHLRGKIFRQRQSYQEALKMRGFEAKSDTSEQLAAFLEKDYIKNRDLIHKLGLHVD
jgi:tripartite-type tricarboxylate transporter receptor subunit TctC